jgi:hypothetical protein
MTVQIKRLNNLNLLDVSGWSADTGGSPFFPQNGDTAENQRLYDTGPYGQTVLVWGTYPTGGSNADGGWEGSSISIDRTKTYRYSVWVRRTSSTSGGTFYFGLHSNGTGDVYGLHSGSSETNPYFDYRSTSYFAQNQWYLVVGHVYPETTVTPHNGHPDNGIWTRTGGKVMFLQGNIPNGCKWGGNASTGMNRTYHYYCGDTTTRLQFYAPRIEVVDGNEPTIQHLLTKDLISPSTTVEAIIYGDGTAQASSGDTNNNDSGELISVSAYTSSGTFTWNRPTNCSTVLVKVIGGGGGAAGYCESGGAGGYSEKLINVQNINSVTVTVGGGGSNVGYYAGAGNGGTSSFGSFVSASGGYGSNQNISHTGGYGGGGSGGDVNLYGGTGTGHSNSHSHAATARGGDGYFGGAVGFNRTTSGARVGVGAPGNGGAGGRTNEAWAGSVGQSGAVIIWEYR